MIIGLAETTVALLVACLSGLIAVVSLSWQVKAESQRQRREHEFTVAQREAERRDEAEQLIRRYREPLVFAADQLANRIYNIRMRGFFEKYLASHHEYAINSTLYAIAEMLAWMELLRQDQQFLDLGEEDATRDLNECLATVGRAFSTDTILDPDGHPAAVMVWRQQQRAIGEVMIDRSKDQARCLGFATFTERLAKQSFSRWFEPVAADVERIALDPRCGAARLEELSVAVRALIENLDPAGIRVARR